MPRRRPDRRPLPAVALAAFAVALACALAGPGLAAADAAAPARDAASTRIAANAGADAAAPSRAVADRRARRVRRGPGACPAARGAVPRGRAARVRAKRALLCLINRERTRRGVPPLRADRCLARAARRHTRDMVRRRYFSHTSRDGRRVEHRVRRAGYVPRRGGWRIGENLYWGSRGAARPAAVVRGWLRSPGHRANLLSRAFRDVGLAAVPGAPARAHAAAATYTADFGARGGARARCK